MTLNEAALERHYTVDEIAELWNWSPDLVRRLFRDEPGVVILCHPRAGRRVYRSVRIPESVLRRVHKRMRRE